MIQLILFCTFSDWDKDHVDLQWTPPKKDGGSPITAYIIEKRSKYGYAVIDMLEILTACLNNIILFLIITATIFNCKTYI